MRSTLPPNPFDFSTPARDKVFAGRIHELAILRKYAQSITDETQAHLLIHGRRGIGKTSLIGQARKELARRGVVTAEIAVDEGSAAETEFFFEVLIALATAVIEAGGFGGRGEKYEEQLRRAVLGHDVPDAHGPLSVVSFVAAGRQAVRQLRIPDAFISDDIAALVDEARELGAPGLALVIDEADRLAKSPQTVQRLRNALVMPGFISTILCGTDDTLSAMDAAFAPAGRHFHKLELRPLADLSETFECIFKPLVAANALETVQVSLDVVREVHRLTRGSPYEIALVCHVMYDQLGSDRPAVLTLNDRVLEHVASQLRPAPEDHAAMTVLRQASDEVVRVAARYCVDPQVTLHEHSLIRIAFEAPAPDRLQQAQTEILEEWQMLADHGLAEGGATTLKPEFGELTRLYLKYRARALGSLPNQVEGAFSDRLADRVTDELRDLAADGHGGFTFLFPRSHVELESGRNPSTARDLALIDDGDFDDLVQSGSFIASLPAVVTDADVPGGATHAILVVPFEIGEDGFEAVLHFAGPDLTVDSLDPLLDEIRGFFEEAIAYKVALGKPEFVCVTSEDWAQWHQTRDLMMTLGQMTESWSIGDRPRAAAEAARALADHTETLDGTRQWGEHALQLLNNYGFMELAAGHLVHADDLLQRCAARGGVQPNRDPLQRAILLCNLAVTAAGQGRYPEGSRWLDDLETTLDESNLALRAGWLVVFTPDPDWPHEPKLIVDPDVRAVSRMTRAAIMAASDDASAMEVATETAEQYPDRWVFECLAAVATRLRLTDVAAEAQRRARTTPESEADGEVV
jgi:hypothetical protein